MLLPYGTDAPIYHRPIATSCILALNAALFLFTGMGHYEAHRWLILEFARINPLQWVTAACMHASWCHLIGNMIMLWCLGLIVEGKLGWRRFCLLYLCLALADGAISQIPMFMFTSGQGGALGASGVIFALLAVALIWAPANDIHFLYYFGWILFGTVDIPISVVAAFYFGIEFLEVLVSGVSMSTPMLHLLGMSVGFPFAIGMLKYRMVDCEGWDLLTRIGIPLVDNESTEPEASEEQETDLKSLALARPRSVARKLAQSGESLPQTGHLPVGQHRDPCANAIDAFRRALYAGNCDHAACAFAALQDNGWVCAVSDTVLVAYVKVLAKNSRHAESLKPLRHLSMRKHSPHCNGAKLRVAAIRLRQGDDPRDAIQVLREMATPISEEVAEQRKRILRAARSRMQSLQTHAPGKRLGHDKITIT